MNPLKNEKHERFAQLVALGSSHQSAALSAGFRKGNGISVTAARLLNLASVSARIDWLKERAAERAEVTLESLISDAQRCRDLGIWHGQINAAVLAVKELGILTGFRVERRETRRIDPATISDEELAQIIRNGSVDAIAVTPAPQRALNDGRNAGINGGENKKSAMITDASGANAVPARGIEPPLDPVEALSTPEARQAWRTKMAARADRHKSRARSKG